VPDDDEPPVDAEHLDLGAIRSEFGPKEHRIVIKQFANTIMALGLALVLTQLLCIVSPAHGQKFTRQRAPFLRNAPKREISKPKPNKPGVTGPRVSVRWKPNSKVIRYVVSRDKRGYTVRTELPQPPL